MEQDRASSVFVHHHQLAGQAVAQLSHDPPTDCRDDNRHRPQSARRIGRKQISQRCQSLRRPTRHRQPRYDDPQSVYPEIKEQLVAAIKAAHFVEMTELSLPSMLLRDFQLFVKSPTMQLV